MLISHKMVDCHFILKNNFDKPELVGELCYEKLRGSDCYAFKFDENWLKVYAGINLSDDINNYPGMQYTQPGNDILDVFRMHCQTDGDELCLKEENKSFC